MRISGQNAALDGVYLLVECVLAVNLFDKKLHQLLIPLELLRDNLNLGLKLQYGLGVSLFFSGILHVQHHHLLAVASFSLNVERRHLQVRVHKLRNGR